MSATDSVTTAMLVGAFERDNFGDLLFLLVTEDRLRRAGVATAAAAPMASPMFDTLGRFIPAYPPMLERNSYGAVWAVGGELGGVDQEGAYRFSLTADEFQVFREAGAAGRAAITRVMSGGDIVGPAYLPDVARWPRQRSTPFIVNSVGLSGASHLDDVAFSAFRSAVQRATRISVRDSASSRLLDELEQPHHLGPDVVHAVAELLPRVGPTEPKALLQIPERELEARTEHAFVEAVLNTPAIEPLELVFFAAGVAPGHDSVDRYDSMAAELAVAGRRVRVIHERAPQALVAEISTAALWIGTSLHGRVVSSAFRVPRVGLATPKLDAYAAQWDPAMPYAVEPSGLPEAARVALLDDVRARADSDARSLERSADGHLQQLVDEVAGWMR